MEKTPEGSVRLDDRALKVLAHPLRSRLLSALRLDGPATSTALAGRLGTNTGATSYHLRQLAEVGLVVETGEGRGRERWWRAAHDSHSFVPSDAGSADARAAQVWLRGEYQRQYLAWAEAWQARAESYPPAWQDAAGSSDYALELTADQLARFVDDVDALVERYRTDPPPRPEPVGSPPPSSAPAASPDPSAPSASTGADDVARPVLVVLHAFPRVDTEAP